MCCVPPVDTEEVNKQPKKASTRLGNSGKVYAHIHTSQFGSVAKEFDLVCKYLVLDIYIWRTTNRTKYNINKRRAAVRGVNKNKSETKSVFIDSYLPTTYLLNRNNRITNQQKIPNN